MVHSLGAPGAEAPECEVPASPSADEALRVARAPAPPSAKEISLVTEEGSRVSGETSSRLCCDAEVVPIERAADGSVLDVGRRRRTVGWRLRKALDARDRGCRFPGCGSRHRTHAHHIRHWAHGGKTAMDNLVLLCPFHHRAVHEGGWTVEMDERGMPRFFNPLGVRMPVVPESPEIGGLLPGDSAALQSADASSRDVGLARWHGQNGIGPWTGIPDWHGERIDLDWALAWFWREEGDGWKEGGAGARDGDPPYRRNL